MGSTILRLLLLAVLLQLVCTQPFPANEGHSHVQYVVDNTHHNIFEGSLEVKLPTIWTDEKQGRVSEEKRRRKKLKKRESLRRKKVAKHCVCPMICGSGGSKSRLAKAAGAEPAGQMRDEQLHAVVARSTFRSQNVQNKPGSDHSWKLRCRKSARRCGAKHISKSKCTKQTRFGPFLEVAMSKKCTPLWREAHFEVKMYKTNQVRTIFGSCDVEKVHAVVARSTFRSQNVQNTPGPDHFWKLRRRKSARRCGARHISESTCSKTPRSPHVRTTFVSRGRRTGADFLRRVAFWSIRFSGLLR